MTHGKFKLWIICCAQSFSHVWLFVTLWTVACQAPLSMGSLQARTLGWVAMPSSREITRSSPILKWKVKSLSRVLLFMTHWTVTRQAPLSMGSLQAKILEWVAIPFSRGSSQPRDGDGIRIPCVSCIAGRFSTHWATKGSEDPLGINGVSTLIGTKRAFRSYDYEPQWQKYPSDLCPYASAMVII